MKKVLIIVPDSNKEKFISKGFSSAFKKPEFFVYEKKIYDLNILEINKMQPEIIFVFWADNADNKIIEQFLSNYNKKSNFIHCAENSEYIPKKFYNLKSHYLFFSNSNYQKIKYVHSVSAEDYKTEFEGYKYNITFTGNPAIKSREIILAALVKNFGRINIFCSHLNFYKSLEDIIKYNLLKDREIELYKKSYKGYVNTTTELADIYISSKINIDISKDNEYDISYRLLEITASGGFVIVPRSENIIKQYDEGKELETYSNINELIDKIKFYGKNITIAQIIALNGKANTVSNFSYKDRLNSMLKVIYGKNFGSR